MNTDVFLEHHGIKGMRWGVRNDPGEGGRAPVSNASVSKKKSLTTKQKVAIGVGIGAVLVGAYSGVKYKQALDGVKNSGSFAYRVERFCNSASYDPINGASFLETKTFDKGTKFLRTSRTPETSINTRAFATLTEPELERYHALFSGKYRVEIEALKDVKIPSIKDRDDVLLPLMDKTYRSEVANRRDKNSVFDKLAAYTAPKQDILNSVLTDEHLKEWKTDRAKKLIAALSEKGYAGIWDDWDGTVEKGSTNSAVMLFENPEIFQIKSKE